MQTTQTAAEATTAAAVTTAVAATPPTAPAKKIAAKAAPKSAAKPVTKTAAKPAPKATTKPAAKPVAKPVAKPAAKPVAKPAAKAVAKVAAKTTPLLAKPPKEKKIKMVRDSISIPKAEYTVLDSMKLRCGRLGVAAKKTELIRAGIKALAALPDAAFLAAVRAVPNLKTGRPAKTA